MWNHCFLTAANARHMYQLAEKQGDNNAMAIALTMKVYYMSILTDLYGDIPYQEALRGAEGIIRPVVESQKSVYEGMMADLETANSLYKLNNVLADATKDKMFAGDIAKWRSLPTRSTCDFSTACRCVTRSSRRALPSAWPP